MGKRARERRQPVKAMSSNRSLAASSWGWISLGSSGKQWRCTPQIFLPERSESWDIYAVSHRSVKPALKNQFPKTLVSCMGGQSGLQWPEKALGTNTQVLAVGRQEIKE